MNTHSHWGDLCYIKRSQLLWLHIIKKTRFIKRWTVFNHWQSSTQGIVHIVSVFFQYRVKRYFWDLSFLLFFNPLSYSFGRSKVSWAWTSSVTDHLLLWKWVCNSFALFISYPIVLSSKLATYCDGWYTHSGTRRVLLFQFTLMQIGCPWNSRTFVIFNISL